MNILLGGLLIASLVLIQCLIGGTRFVFSFPSYALVGVAAVLSVFFLRRRGPKPAAFCVGAALLLAGYAAARAWFSPIPYLARQDLFLIPAALAVYLLTVYYVNTSRARFWVVGALMAVGVAHVVVGMVQFQGQTGFMLFGFVREASRRASGMLICGNHMAGYLEALAVMTLSLTVWSRLRVGVKMLIGYLVALFYLGVVLSGSRGGYLSSVISLAAFGALTLWIIHMYNRRIFVVALVAVLAVGALCVGGAGYTMTRNHFLHERMVRLSHATQDMRYYLWLASLDQFKLSPLVGTGAGTHLHYGRLLRRPAVQDADPVHSHCDYLELLAEYGLIGELLAGIFLAAHLFNGLRATREITLRRLCNTLVSARSDSLALTVGALAAVVALMAHSVVDFNMHIPGNALLFAFFFGILSNPGLEHSPSSSAGFSPGILVRVGLCLLGVALLAGIGVKYNGERLTEKVRVALRNGEYGACIEFGLRAVAVDPSNPYAYFHLGEAYRMSAVHVKIPPLRAVWFEKAIDAYRGGLEYFPQDENLTVRLGQALDGARRFDEAEAVYEDAIRSDPNLGILYAYYGAHLQLVGKADAAKRNFERASRLGAARAEAVGMDEVRSILQTAPEKNEGDVE